MIKYKTILGSKDFLIKTSKKVLDRYQNIAFAYLFGSLVRSETSLLADVDIAVYLKENTDMAAEKLSILGSLIEHLDTDEIDLVIFNTAPLPLKARIIQNRQILVDKEPSRRHAIESLTLRMYFDFFLKEQALFQRRFSVGR